MDYQGIMNSFKREVYSPVYLLYGEETYLRDEVLATFRTKLLPGEVTDFNLDLLDGNEVTPEVVVGMANTMPFMSDKRLVIVQESEWFKSRKKAAAEDGEEKGAGQEKILLEYLANPLDTTCLIFTAASIDRKKKLYKAVEKAGQVVEFIPFKGKELNDWISRKVHLMGKKITPDAMARMITALGSNLRLIENELQKLVFYIGVKEQITLDDVTNMVSKTVENSIFDLVDAVGERKYNLALQLTNEMIFYGEPPIKILYMIIRQFRIIYAAKIMHQQGYSEKQVASKIQVHPFVAQKCIRQGRNFSTDELDKALYKLLEADEALKTGKQEPVLAMERLIVELCS